MATDNSTPGLIALNDTVFQEKIAKPCSEILSQVIKDTQDCDIGLVCPAISLRIRRFIKSGNFGGFVGYKVEEIDHQNISLEVFDEARRVKLQARRSQQRAF